MSIYTIFTLKMIFLNNVFIKRLLLRNQKQKSYEIFKFKINFIMLTFSMTSCSSDDNEETVSVEKANIVGTWEVVSTMWSDSENKTEVTDDYVEALIIIKEDGTGIFDDEPVHWTLEGNKLTVTINGTNIKYDYVITSLTNNTMKILYKTPADEDGYWEQEEMTLTRK